MEHIWKSKPRWVGVSSALWTLQLKENESGLNLDQYKFLAMSKVDLICMSQMPFDTDLTSDQDELIHVTLEWVRPVWGYILICSCVNANWIFTSPSLGYVLCNVCVGDMQAYIEYMASKGTPTCRPMYL